MMIIYEKMNFTDWIFNKDCAEQCMKSTLKSVKLFILKNFVHYSFIYLFYTSFTELL